MSAFKQAALVALAVLWLAPSALAQVPAAAPAPAVAAAQAPAPAVTRSDYRIGVYDVLEIDVFEINDLHRQVQVDGSGVILLPLVGAVPALGRTPAELSDDLRQRLETRYVNNAKVEVQIRQSQSEHVTVDGAVTEPGAYPLGGPTTLLQAVAMAKGPDGVNANVHKVSLFRTVDARWTRTEYDLAKIRNGQIADPVMQGRDVVVVAGSRKHEILRDLGNILPMVLLLASL